MAQLDDEGDLWERHGLPPTHSFTVVPRRFTFGKGEVRILEDWAGESGLGGARPSRLSCYRTHEYTIGSVWDPSITLCRYLDSDDVFPAGFWHGKRVLGALPVPLTTRVSICLCAGGRQHRELDPGGHQSSQFRHKQLALRTDCSYAHVEVGSGCGLLGIFAAKLGATVTLTDQPYVLPNLERNVNLNLGSFSITSLHTNVRSQ